MEPNDIAKYFHLKSSCDSFDLYSSHKHTNTYRIETFPLIFFFDSSLHTCRKGCLKKDLKKPTKYLHQPSTMSSDNLR